MGSIIGIPTTRVSDLFIRQRLTAQVQMDQLALFQTQMQLSTGRRFQTPSEDADAALRVLGLQQLLERKDQVQSNLATNQSYLAATDIALSTVSNSLAEVRGVALGVLGTVAIDVQRAAAAQQVQELIRQLLDVGNQKFRGRYLFAGTGTTVRPFAMADSGLIRYDGDEGRLSSYSDIDLLFDTNVNGNEVFGAISEPVRGSEDLRPAVTYHTRLADLRGGRGITSGSIAISDGTTISTVDISSAETIGDVAALIRANPPTARNLHVEVSGTGLWIQLDGLPQDRLTIREVGGGTTADELGILTETATAAPVVGNDLNPILRNTTRIDNILGVRARAVVRTGGPDNDLIFEAPAAGAAHNGTKIIFVDDGSVITPGTDEVARYNQLTDTLIVSIKTNGTRARDVVSAVNAAFELGDVPLTARLDPLDYLNGGQGYVGVTPLAEAAGVTAGGSGTPFDKESGLRIVNGTTTCVIDFAGAETIEAMLNILNMSDAGVLAEINESATGINIRSRISGADFMIGENGGSTASELGVRTFTRQTRLEDLNFAAGVLDYEGNAKLASATLTSSGSDNDLVIRAQRAGVAWNDFQIRVIDSGGPPGSETLTYDPVAKTMVFAVVPGSTTANDLVDLFQSTPGARDDFKISLDPVDGSANPGKRPVDLLTATTSGGDSGGTDFTITLADESVIEIDLSANDGSGPVAATDPLTPPEVSGGSALGYATATVELPGPDNDLIFHASNFGTSYDGTKINFQENPGAPAAVVSYIPGVELTFQFDPAVTTAQDLVAALQAHPAAGADFSATLDPTDGSPAETIGQVLDLINDQAPGSLQARLATYGNGIELVDLSQGTEGLVVTNAKLSTAAIGLGLIPPGGETSGPATAQDSAGVTVASAAPKSNLIFTATDPGTQANGVRVILADTGVPGVVYDEAAGTLTFGITAGVTTAQDIINDLNASSAADVFSATLDPTDTSGNDGSGTVEKTDPNSPPVMYGGDATTKTATIVTSSGLDNDLIISAQAFGPALNGTAVELREVVGGPVAFNYIGNTLTVDFDPGVTTAQNMVAALAADPLGATFLATLDPDDASGNDGSGTVDPGVSAPMSDGSQVLTGTDVHLLETDGIFTALLRLQAALEDHDVVEAERAIALLDRRTTDLDFARAGLGARQQSLDVIQDRLATEEITLRETLSKEFDVDIVEAISTFTGRQAAFEASLRTAAQIFQMSLLNYL